MSSFTRPTLPASPRAAGRSARPPGARAPALRRSSRRRARRPRRSCRGRARRAALRARLRRTSSRPLLASGSRCASSRPTTPSSSSLAKTTSGPSARAASRKSSTPLSRIALQEARSRLTRAPWSRASSAARSAALRTGSTLSAYPETWRCVQPASHAGSSSSGRRSRADPRSAAMDRSPPGDDERADRAVPACDRTEDLDAERRQPRANERAALVGARLPDESRCGAELGRPGGDVRGLPAWPDADLGVGVAARRDRPGEADDHVERQISERADEHDEHDRKIRAWTANGVVGCGRSCSEGSWAPRLQSRRRIVVGASSAVAVVRAVWRRSRALPATSSSSSASAMR